MISDTIQSYSLKIIFKVTFSPQVKQTTSGVQQSFMEFMGTISVIQIENLEVE